MRAVIQRVKFASVEVEAAIQAEIQHGLLVFIGIEDADCKEDVEWLAKKTGHLRIFNDEQGVMNRSILETKGDVLVVSQFTLHASTKKGNRPSYIKASKPEFAVPMYELFCDKVGVVLGKEVKNGIFGADMKVHLLNDGPVTIIIDTKNKD